ncbi:MAG TPA: alkaline phosphatase family protein [Solirubrobacteraceae bacterium]|nr:alkaline phosphatase family protein [Solirubrobacteraceae bacterium]
MTDRPTISRRQLLARGGAAAAGLAAAGAYGGLPAWARPVASAASGPRAPGSLPFPHLPAGHPTPGLEQIEHVVVLMMENHSFDNLLGMVPYQVKGRAHVDGLTLRRKTIINSNPSSIAPYGIMGPDVPAQRASSPCQGPGVSQSWNASHTAWNNGANNGFVQASSDQAMSFWDRGYLPASYSLAQHFPIGERYFCSVLAATYPNRRFLFCGTASGLTATNNYTFQVPAANGTIFNQLLEHNISWLNYVTPTSGTLEGSPLIVPEFARSTACTDRMVPIARFFTDAAHGKLPSFSFLDPNYVVDSEENPQDIQAGERFIAQVAGALLRSRRWHKTALFITWDEHGGYYDHVRPPAAIAPDSIAPLTTPEAALTDPSQPLAPGGYDRYGFRVPLLVISPWARANYASRVVQDHTSILAFVERKWNLPALSFRDANAHPMTDYFDFRRPAFAKPPKLAAPPAMAPGLAECERAGLTPPVGTPGL